MIQFFQDRVTHTCVNTICHHRLVACSLLCANLVSEPMLACCCRINHLFQESINWSLFGRVIDISWMPYQGYRSTHQCHKWNTPLPRYEMSTTLLVIFTRVAPRHHVSRIESVMTSFVVVCVCVCESIYYQLAYDLTLRIYNISKTCFKLQKQWLNEHLLGNC